MHLFLRVAAIAVLIVGSPAGGHAKPRCTVTQDGSLTRPFSVHGKRFALEVKSTTTAGQSERGVRLTSGKSEVLAFDLLISRKQLVQTTFHFGKGFHGVQQVQLVTVDGKTFSGNVDGRPLVPFQSGADAKSIKFADGLPAPVFKLKRVVIAALKKGGHEIDACSTGSKAIRVEFNLSCTLCDLKCSGGSVKCMAEAAGEAAACFEVAGPGGIACGIVGGLLCASTAQSCEGGCDAPGGPCCESVCQRVDGQCCDGSAPCCGNPTNPSPVEPQSCCAGECCGDNGNCCSGLDVVNGAFYTERCAPPAAVAQGFSCCWASFTLGAPPEPVIECDFLGGNGGQTSAICCDPRHGEQCFHGPTGLPVCCPPSNPVCGDHCCPGEGMVCRDAGTGLCCAPGAGDECGSTCCAPGETCASPVTGSCCPAGEAACTGGCCAVGEVCATGASGIGTCCSPGDLCNGTCCPQPNVCLGNGTCCGPTYGTSVCGQSCCGLGDTCCNGTCCGPGSECVGLAQLRFCCPTAQLCGLTCCAADSICTDPSTGKCLKCPQAGWVACSPGGAGGDPLCCPPGVQCCAPLGGGASTCCQSGQECCPPGSTLAGQCSATAVGCPIP
jgi:hypothetical protein